MTSGWFCSPATPAVPRCPRLHALCPGPPGKAPAATHQEGPVPSKCPFPDMPATSVMCVFSTTTRAKLMRVRPSESARWSGEPPPLGGRSSSSLLVQGWWLGWSSEPSGHPLTPQPSAELTQGMEKKRVIKVRAQLGARVRWRLGGGSKVWKRAAPAVLSPPKSGAAVQGQWEPFRWELQHGGSPPPGPPSPRLPSLRPPGRPSPPSRGQVTPHRAPRGQVTPAGS